MSDKAKDRFFKILALIRAGETAQAATAIKTALQVAPKDPNMLQLAAQLAERQKEPGRAIMFYKRVLDALPLACEPSLNLARLLVEAKQEDEALSLLENLTRQHPSRPDVFEALARLHQRQENLMETAAAWDKVYALAPDHPTARGFAFYARRQACDWSQPEPTDALLSAHMQVMFDDPAKQKEAAERFIKGAFGAVRAMPPAPAWNHKRLRIAYLSSDFHAHATSWLIAELFSLHDKDKFEIFAYSYGVEDHSPIRERLRREAEHFVVLNDLTAQGCAQKIRADEIDILIELKGHTHGAHLDIAAYRPAPVQLHWLGFPATIGAPFLDGFIGDAITIPPENEKFFTEKVYRLPHCYQINDRQKEIGTPLSRTEYGLPETGLVLASFNQSYKITPEIFSLWCEILKEIPDAVLWLYDAQPLATQNLKKEAATRGVDPARLVFVPAAPQAEHLARYKLVDLALDTFPVGGHTTTSDALWAGVPVVTKIGQSFVTRVAASLLTNAELPELITQDDASYKKLVLSLARDKEKLQQLHTHLTTKHATLPLFDTPQFVKDFESLLLQIS